MAILGQIAWNFQPQVFPEFISGYAPVVFWMALAYTLHLLPNSLEHKTEYWVGRLPLPAKALLVCLFAVLVMQVKSSDVQPFIYFQF